MSPFYPSLKPKKIIIFDFDGVLADSFDSLYSLIREGMARIGLTLTKNQYREFFLNNVHRGFRDFIGHQIKFQAFAEFRADNFDQYYKNTTFFPGAQDFISQAAADHILAVASSGREKNITDLLEKNGVRGLFSMILASAENTKENMLKKILNKFNISKSNRLMLTDTVGDIKIAQKLELKTIAVTWGFHPEQWLIKARPDYIANDFSQLAKIIEKFE